MQRPNNEKPKPNAECLKACSSAEKLKITVK